MTELERNSSKRWKNIQETIKEVVNIRPNLNTTTNLELPTRVSVDTLIYSSKFAADAAPFSSYITCEPISSSYFSIFKVWNKGDSGKMEI